MEKDIKEIILGIKDISILDNMQVTDERFLRWKNILLTFIRYGKSYCQFGLNENNLGWLIEQFDVFYNDNIILQQYVNIGQIDEKEIEIEIDKFYKTYLSAIGISIDFSQIQSEEISNVEQEVNKTLTKSNGHSLLDKDNKSKGYVGAFLISLLAATIEVTTVAYILLKGL